MHSILMAPRGTANGLLGLGALINVCATLPANYVAFEYPTASDPWWEDLIIGLPDEIVKDSMVDILETPGLGLDIDVESTKKYLKEEDAGFFDLNRSAITAGNNQAKNSFQRTCHPNSSAPLAGVRSQVSCWKMRGQVSDWFIAMPGLP